MITKTMEKIHILSLTFQMKDPVQDDARLPL